MNSKLKNCSKKTQPVILNLSLDFNVNSHLCYKMVSGIIKHVLYHREQIPEPFDQLLKTCAKLEESKINQVTNLIGARARQKEIQLCKLAKIFSDLFTNLETIFLNVKKLNVRRVAVILGATLVTPREIHCIELPVEMYSDQTKSRLPLIDQSISCRYVAQMFRTLYITSNAVVWPNISPTNVTVLVEMKCDCHVNWFLPKSSYSLPERGHTVIYKIKATVSTPALNGLCRSSAAECRLKNRKTDFDIYESPQACGWMLNTIQTGVDINCSSITSGICNISITESQVRSESTSDENYIWYQMPGSAKGFTI